MFENFDKKLHLQKYSTKNQFVDKFQQKIALGENFHAQSICGKISKKNKPLALLENFQKKNVFLKKFHKITLCWKNVTIGLKIAL